LQSSQPEPTAVTRELTDASLLKERRKVDSVLAEGASVTGAALDESRTDADAATKEQRAITDAGAQAGSQQLARERELTDATLEEERGEADRAIERERRLRLALEASRRFGAERQGTDTDLASERGKSDEALLETSWLLSEERAAHEGTRQALTTRDQFLAIVSHDLRSPLSAVLAGTSILANAPELGAEDGRLRQAVERIRLNTTGMLRMIGDLLDVERIGAGKFVVALREQDLRSIAKRVAAMFEAAAAKKSLRLSVELPAEPLVVDCDGERIAQVIANLLDNAVKFTTARGAVVVSVTKVGSWAQVSVGDTGPGIPEAARARIFERFSQLPSSDRTGLGLGLFIAKSIIAEHEGQLWVASAPGQGSVFSFALRVAR
jgi:signal transduction histidine kinase